MNGYLESAKYCEPPQVAMDSESVRPTLLEEYKRRKARAQSEVDKMNEIITALESSPEVEKLLSLIVKTGRL